MPHRSPWPPGSSASASTPSGPAACSPAWPPRSQLLALVWLRLDQAGVVTVEAYTLPLAVALLAVGLIGARLDRSDGGEPGSWITYGPALVVGLAPTVWLSFAETGSIRPLVGLVTGALVLVGGVVWGKRALVDVGTVTVAALGLQQIAPVVGEIPNWATIGATGILLIIVGATFEQRRRDLKAVLRRYSALT
ncbi:SCO7613 C-terminal domain-containing membrane protein [Aquihabitans daechungensis]|uniref:SCO7613 C-terminal domain-containing membrane protein n=1 Tax=Aquihabitans daechungensis TaxID=1052257 RepID=UPI003BA2F980